MPVPEGYGPSILSSMSLPDVESDEKLVDDMAKSMAKTISADLDEIAISFDEIVISLDKVESESNKLTAKYKMEGEYKIYTDESIYETLSKASIKPVNVSMGFTGPKFIETGYFYTPYIPLFSTPTLSADAMMSYMSYREREHWDTVLETQSELLGILGFIIPAPRKMPIFPMKLDSMGWVFPLCADLSKFRKEAYKKKEVEDEIDIFARVMKKYTIDTNKEYQEKIQAGRDLDI